MLLAVAALEPWLHARNVVYYAGIMLHAQPVVPEIMLP